MTAFDGMSGVSMDPVPGYRPLGDSPKSRRERWAAAIRGTLPFGVFMVGVCLVIGHRSLAYAVGYSLLMGAGFAVVNFLRTAPAPARATWSQVASAGGVLLFGSACVAVLFAAASDAQHAAKSLLGLAVCGAMALCSGWFFVRAVAGQSVGARSRG